MKKLQKIPKVTTVRVGPGYPYSYGDYLSEEQARKNFYQTLYYFLPLVTAATIYTSKVDAYEHDAITNFRTIERVMLPVPMIMMAPVEPTPMVVVVVPTPPLPVGLVVPLPAPMMAPLVPLPASMVPPVAPTPTPMVASVAPYAPTFRDKLGNLSIGYYVAAIVIAKAYKDGNTLGATINAIIFAYILYRKLK